MRLSVFLCLAGGSVLALAAAPPDRAARDGELIRGKWDLVRGQDEGKQVPARKLQDSKVTISGDTIRIVDKDNKQTWLMSYKLDPSQTPRAITMTITEGEGRGKTALGIYALDGDNLKICYALPGYPRPQAFATKSNDRELLFVMKRVKP